MPGAGAPIPTVLKRGALRRCPRCGQGKLFDGFFTLRDTCDACGLDLSDRHGDTFGILYVITGAITGFFIVLLLLITPRDLRMGRLLLIPVVAAAYGATIPFRRGLAIAVSHLIKRATDEDENQDARG